MKKAIPFMKITPITFTISLIVIIGGFIGTLIQGGFNQGIDFVGGYNQQIQFAPKAFSVTYSGTGQIDTVIQNGIITFAIQESDRNENLKYNFKDYASIEQLVEELKKVNGLTLDLATAYSKATTDRLLNTDYNVILNSNNPSLTVNIKLENNSDIFVTKDKLGKALSEFGRFSIQTVGIPLDQKFIIKINNKDAKQVVSKEKPAVTDNTSGTSSEQTTAEGLSKTEQDQIELKIKESLARSFEKDATLFQKKDYIGSTFSKEIAQGAIWSVVLAILLILVYVSFRFKLVYAVAAVLALVHDCAVMLGVIGTLQIEFNTISIAAILTILGYSINDTIVVFDRIRENHNIMRDVDRLTMINTSITQTLSRTLITSLTTLLAIVSIFIVSNGIIRDFAFNLMIGVISGTYSSIYIAAFVVLTWQNIADKKKKEKQDEKIGKIKTETTTASVKSSENTEGASSGDDSSAEKTGEEQPIQRKLRRKRKK